MNFVFFSPHFPANGADFCDRLKKAGATVLGIGDAPFAAAPQPACKRRLSALPVFTDPDLNLNTP